MSEQLKPYEMMHKDPIGGTMINSLWYRKQDADAALAAKDARIAELEQSQGAEVFLTLTGEISKLRAQLASQQQAEPKCSDGGDCGIGGYFKECPLTATRSEDGRMPPPERLKVWELIDSALSGKIEPMLRGDICNILAPLLAPLAQPARQVGEYGDAYQGAREDLAIWKRRALEAEESVRRKDQIIDHLTLEAQGETRMGEPVIPNARQVGGDEPYPEGTAEALERSDWTPEEALRWYAEGRHFDTVEGRTRIIDTGSIASNALKHLSLPYLEMKGDAELHELRRARAALAPAAVAVVMPERDDYHQIAFEIGGTEDGAYHFEADELDNFVARLNRRAIPAGLLERIAKMPSSPEAEMDRYEACDELRSLLSQQQEGGV